METTKPTFAAAQPDAARATLFRNVYLWMTMALALTALTAYTVAGSETLLQAIFSSRFVFLGLIVAELVLVFVLAANIMRMSFLTATLMFIAYSVVNGATLSTIFLVYDLGRSSSRPACSARCRSTASSRGATSRRGATC